MSQAPVRRPEPLGLIAVVAAILCFSVSSSIVKWSESPGAAIAFWRMLFASVLWWAIVAVRRMRTGVGVPYRDAWRWAFLPGIFFGLNIAVFFVVIQHTSIAHAEFIGALSPLILLPAGAVLFHEHPDWGALRWGGLTVLGVAIVLFAGGDQGDASLKGDLGVMTAIGLWVCYLLASRRARNAHIDVVTFMSCMMPIALLATAPIALFVVDGGVWPVPAKGWIAVGILTFLTGIAAHGLIVFAQQHVPVATIGVMQVGQPALAVLWGWIILGEGISLAQVPGMVLVVVGLALFTIAGQRRAPAELVPISPGTLDAETTTE